MKILYHHRIASKDGQYVHIEEIVNALKNLGHEIVMVEPKSIHNKSFGESSSLVKNLRSYLPGFVHELAEFSYSFIDYWRLKNAIQRHKPDVIYERYNLYFTSGIWASKKFGLPILLEVNAPLYDERSENDHISIKKLAIWSEVYAWKNADYVLPVTAVLAARIQKNGVNASQIKVIPNGINRLRFAQTENTEQLKQKLGIEKQQILGFTGFVRDWHRLDRVLDVLQLEQFKDWRFLVVGDGPARESLENKAREMGLTEKILFTGLISRDDINKYVSCFDIALQPDVVEYASPLKLFEYLALGKPVLAPDSPNITEILTHGENALLFDVTSDRDFKDKLHTLCESTKLQQDLGAAAKQLVEDQGYYWEKNAEIIIELFDQLIDGHSETLPAPN